MATTDRSSEYEIEVIDTECILIRNLLGTEEQAAIFQYIQDHDCTPWDTMPKAMVPTPKTLLFGKQQYGKETPALTFTLEEKNVLSELILSANECLRADDGVDLDMSHTYKSLTMAAIRYHAPDGRFPPHCDHCNDSYVYLLSLGCTANFMVQGPGMTEKRFFKFHSGDLLVFNASTEAAILHEVCSIDTDGDASGLSGTFRIMRDHRFGVQIRARY